jgi:hypothetical protein
LHNWMFILLSRVNHDLGQHDTCRSFVELSRQFAEMFSLLSFFPCPFALPLSNWPFA